MRQLLFNLVFHNQFSTSVFSIYLDLIDSAIGRTAFLTTVRTWPSPNILTRRNSATLKLLVCYTWKTVSSDGCPQKISKLAQSSRPSHSYSAFFKPHSYQRSRSRTAPSAAHPHREVAVEPQASKEYVSYEWAADKPRACSKHRH